MTGFDLFMIGACLLTAVFLIGCIVGVEMAS